jgi:hypothetical protein
VVLMRGFIALVSAAVAAAHFAVPFRLIDNREFVDAYVNGKGPYAFVVDTGSSTLITPEVAAATGVASVDAGLSGGVGEKREPMRQAVVDRLAFGDVSLTRLAVSVGSLREIRDAIGFARLDGIIGSDVLKRYRTRIDGMGAKTMQLSDAAPVGTALPFRIVGGEIVVSGSVNGIAGDFIVDTGDRSTLTLFGPFVERHGLGDAKGVVAVTGWGVGGPVRARVTRADFAAGPLVGRNVVARQSLQRAGAFTDPRFAGSIGNGLLKNYALTFDYDASRLYVAPSAGRPQPDAYDRSGMWLRRVAAGFEVAGTVSGGPADEAGLHAGDVVVAVDGVPAAAVDLIALRARLAATTVKTVRVRVSHPGGGDNDAIVSLRALV